MRWPWVKQLPQEQPGCHRHCHTHQSSQCTSTSDYSHAASAGSLQLLLMSALNYRSALNAVAITKSISQESAQHSRGHRSTRRHPSAAGVRNTNPYICPCHLASNTQAPPNERWDWNNIYSFTIVQCLCGTVAKRFFPYQLHKTAPDFGVTSLVSRITGDKWNSESLLCPPHSSQSHSSTGHQVFTNLCACCAHHEFISNLELCNFPTVSCFQQWKWRSLWWRGIMSVIQMGCINLWGFFSLKVSIFRHAADAQWNPL